MTAFYHSTGDDVFRHLACEEYLLDTLPSGGWRMMVWSSHDAVVIGKHQNPWLECDLQAMEEDGVKLARRLSGGGAVWHDPGNLNYTFILERDAYDREALQTLVLQAVRSLGVPAELGERHILTVDGRKFSGNAFCFRRQKVLHHGTLLLRADLQRLDRYLRQQPGAIQTRAVASVPSPVVNLCDYAPKIDTAVMTEALYKAASMHLEVALPRHDAATVQAPAIQDAFQRQQQWDWRYGYTPKFDIEWTCDGQPITVHVERARITSIQGSCPHELSAPLVGCRYHRVAIQQALLDLSPPSDLLDSISASF